MYHFSIDIKIKGSQVNGDFLDYNEIAEEYQTNIISEDTITYTCYDGRDEAGL